MKNVSKLNPIALANTFAAIDLVLHPFFHLWVSFYPNSYEYLMNLFVAGLHLQVTHFDSDPFHIIISTLLEASIFWLLGLTGGKIYNFFNSRTYEK